MVEQHSGARSSLSVGVEQKSAGCETRTWVEESPGLGVKERNVGKVCKSLSESVLSDPLGI